MLSERERHREAELLRIHDLVRPRVLEHPVLVDAGLVGERVRADDRLVRLDGVPGELGDEARRVSDAPDVDAGLVAVGVGADAKRHRDLLERRDAGALADAVDRALDLRWRRRDAGERVRDGEPEVVVAVDGEGDLVELGAEGADLGDERRVLVGEGVADRVGKVDRRRSRLDRGAAHLGDERRVGAGRVLAGELDLVDATVDVGDGRSVPARRPPRARGRA